MCGHKCLQFDEQALLGIQPLDDGLNDQIAVRQFGQRACQHEPSLVAVGHSGLQAIFFNQFVPLGTDGLTGYFRRARFRIHELDEASRLRRNL